jgi:GDPmannose 4,6-dehydratase
MLKKAFITGITGQDGSYLAELLLKKNYIVYGMMRRSSIFNTERIDHIYKQYPKRFNTVYGDLTDVYSIDECLKKIKPDEIYHLGSQSHVGISFKMPEQTIKTNSLSTLTILEFIRKNNNKIKFYQACSSEMFGASRPPQNENTKFLPQSPYGCSKIFSYYLTSYYRRAFKLFAATGILFNHESPRRGLNFVTKKITFNIARLINGEIKKINLGDISIERDWGYAPEYVEAIWRVLQYKKPDDFVIATKETYKIKDFIEECCNIVGLNWKKVFTINNRSYLRPAEVPSLLGNPKKAQKILKWKAKTKFKDLCLIMLKSDLDHVNISIEEAKVIAKKINLKN